MKKFGLLIVLFICLFLNFGSVFADMTDNIYGIDYSKSPIKLYDREEKDNWGVNKHWNINSNNLKNAKSTPLVDSSLKVYDFADILTDLEEKEVKEYIDNFIEKTSIDMVFVSIDMPYTNDSKNESFAADFYDYNDFGIDFENYSGIVLLRNNYSSDRYYDMYTFGNAQLYFDQSRYDNILDDMYPYFSNKKYLEGLKLFVSKCSSYYDSGYVYIYRYSYVDSDGYIHKNFHLPVFACLLGSGIITLIIITILVKKNKMIRKATSASTYLNKDSINYTQHVDQFLNSHTTHYTVSSSSGGGGGFSSGSSGGGHSSGGGRHG